MLHPGLPLGVGSEGAGLTQNRLKYDQRKNKNRVKSFSAAKKKKTQSGGEMGKTKKKETQSGILQAVRFQVDKYIDIYRYRFCICI